MANLPIKHMTLYKHGVGYFERKARVEGERVEFSFRSGEMNDILKSLTVIDSGEGKVLGVDYATPREREELLQGCSIRLNKGNSLRDLLSSLRGCRVRLQLSRDEHLTGTLVGLDVPSKNQPAADTLISILQDDTRQVRIVNLGGIQGVEIVDERGEKDLRFFLDTAREQENHRNVTIRLTPGEHDLIMSYVAPAPTWRVSYRIVLEHDGNGSEPRALLMGWGIFDNLLEEDLEGVSLSLVAGMPISFVYDLATPFTPERPTVKEEARVAAAPVEFEDALGEITGEIEDEDSPDIPEGLMFGEVLGEDEFDYPPDDLEDESSDYRRSLKAIEKSASLSVKSKSMDELFEYDVQTPVTVRRGQSAMVPVISSQLECRKDLIYNPAKMAKHPVATLRLENRTGLTIERGPVTVLDRGEYVGEALMPFTKEEGELVVPYAVELGVKVYKESSDRTEANALGIKDLYLLIDVWVIDKTEYRVNNATARPVKVLVEHPRRSTCELFETIEPAEKTETHYRFAVAVEPKSENVLAVQERRPRRHSALLQNITQSSIENYFRKGLLDDQNREKVLQVSTILHKISDLQSKLVALETEKKNIYKSQKQIHSNMAPLSHTGDEGTLRSQYLQKLKATEDRLTKIEHRTEELKKTLKQSKTEAQRRLKQLEQSM
jgi:hypothetical protein